MDLMRVVLLSTYELGRQPFGLASPAAWLRSRGHEVVCADLALGKLEPDVLEGAGLIAIHLPMHTATRLAARLIPKLRGRARLCCYGLYAPVNDAYLRSLGVDTIIGGEFEHALTDLAAGKGAGTSIVPFDRLDFIKPDRTGLPALDRYARLKQNGVERTVGYTESSRGCKHLCRHCPIVPVYEGRFRVVQRDVVLADIRQQVEAGAEHITFGDPDFFNGPGHAIALVEALHAAYPRLTYDVTIKIEHLLKHRGLLPVLQRTGCLFVTSAVESLDDQVLRKLDKGHTAADFRDAVRLMRENGLPLAPTFIPFTPWTTVESYRELLRQIAEADLVENVAPVQLAIRLLVPSGSRLLELGDFNSAPFDSQLLSYRWSAPADALCYRIQEMIKAEERAGSSRSHIFGKIWSFANGSFPDFHLPARAAIPFLTEPWYC